MNNSISSLRRAALCLSTCAAAFASGTSVAAEAGEWVGRVGVHNVSPKDDNSDIVGVDSAWGVTFSVDYFVTPTLAVDLLLALPFEHDITLNADGSTVASTQHLPPTLSLVWYPAVGSSFQPFIGAGINYTIFFDEQTKGALNGTELDLDSSFGLAAVAGFEYKFSPEWGLMADVRYIDIDTDASVNGTDIGTVEIDPIVYGAALSYHF